MTVQVKEAPRRTDNVTASLLLLNHFAKVKCRQEPISIDDIRGQDLVSVRLGMWPMFNVNHASGQSCLFKKRGVKISWAGGGGWEGKKNLC